MVKRVRKIFLLTLIFCLCLFHIVPVSSYEYVDEDNKTKVEDKRDEIYQLLEMYKFLLGEDSISTLNYNGVCSIVTVEGHGSYALEDYVAGVVKAEEGSEYNNPEFLKAFAIAVRSFVIASKQDSPDCVVKDSATFQVFEPIDPDSTYDHYYVEAVQETTGMVLTRDGQVFQAYYLTYPHIKWWTETADSWVIQMQYDERDPSTAWTLTAPPKETVMAANNWHSAGATDLDHHWGMCTVVATWMARAQEANYMTILKTFYDLGNLTELSTLSDGSYVDNIEFIDSEFGQIQYFNQGAYSNYYFSSNVSSPQYKDDDGDWATIQSHGCGPVAMSIVFSSFQGSSVSPLTTTQQVCNLGGCSSDGALFNSLEALAKQYGYQTEVVPKSGNLQRVIDALESGDSLVVALMGPGTFTTGGHYIVLTGTRSDGSVSVADPGSRARTEQKWFSFNTIAEQVKKVGFIIITR